MIEEVDDVPFRAEFGKLRIDAEAEAEKAAKKAAAEAEKAQQEAMNKAIRQVFSKGGLF
jgi:uncharacterized membrane protein YqiK